MLIYFFEDDNKNLRTRHLCTLRAATPNVYALLEHARFAYHQNGEEMRGSMFCGKVLQRFQTTTAQVLSSVSLMPLMNAKKNQDLD